jgi:hypothetical protein
VFDSQESGDSQRKRKRDKKEKKEKTKKQRRHGIIDLDAPMSKKSTKIFNVVDRGYGDQGNHALNLNIGEIRYTVTLLALRSTEEIP